MRESLPGIPGLISRGKLPYVNIVHSVRCGVDAMVTVVIGLLEDTWPIDIY